MFSKPFAMTLAILLSLLAISYGSTIPANHNKTLAHDEPAPRFVYGWPSGLFGLPKTDTLCPGHGWVDDSRRQTMQETTSSNGAMSDPQHFTSYCDVNYCYEYFCVKTNFEGDPWPQGEYCIHRVSDWCPTGFDYGSIFFDNEDTSNNNRVSGIMPSGEFGVDTLYNYCCRNDGDPDMEIVLPTDDPFYLLPYGSSYCQQVLGMQAQEEWMRIDTEDDNNDSYTDGVHPFVVMGSDYTTVHYCYYS